MKKADKLVVIAYLSSSTQAPVTKFSVTVEKHCNDYLFGMVMDEAVVKASGVTPGAVVVCCSYDELLWEAEIIQWLRGFTMSFKAWQGLPLSIKSQTLTLTPKHPTLMSKGT